MTPAVNQLPSRPPAPQQSVTLYRRIVTLFLALPAGVVLLVVYVVLSRATVTVMSKRDDVKTDFLVDVTRKPGDGEIKGDVLELTDSLTQTFPSESLASVDAHAEGQVKIVSDLGRAQTLVATTRLLTPDGALFRIKKTVTVPAGGSVVVDAFADDAGDKGDVGNMSFTIPGLNPGVRSHFTVTSVAPFVGGKKDVRLITQLDVDQAANVMAEKVKKELADKLRQKAKDGGAPTDGEEVTVDVTGRTTDVPVGSDAAQFALTVTVKATGVFYDKAGFDRMVREKLTEKLMEDHALLAVDQGSVASDVEKRDLDAGRATLHVSAKGTEIVSADAPSLDPTKLTGITADAARQYVESIEGVASASVRVSPFWAGRMPNVADHIKVEVR
jgi:hypothetical protein